LKIQFFRSTKTCLKISLAADQKDKSGMRKSVKIKAVGGVHKLLVIFYFFVEILGIFWVQKKGGKTAP
jgi:hypothetical protein